jgi:hypothetical protein
MTFAEGFSLENSAFTRRGDRMLYAVNGHLYPKAFQAFEQGPFQRDLSELAPKIGSAIFVFSCQQYLDAITTS